MHNIRKKCLSINDVDFKEISILCHVPNYVVISRLDTSNRLI